MAKHTSGPWVIADDGAIEARHLGLVGYLLHASEADSNLIAAAPELFDMLKRTTELLEWLNVSNDPDDALVIEAAWSVLAKAQGEKP